MLKSHPIIAFVATTNPKRAQSFYAKELGLKLISQDPFALVFDAGGTMLRISIVPSLTPATHTILGWQVPNIRATIISLKKKGIRFQRYPGLPQDRSGIWSSPSSAQIAWFKDPDGNVLSLTQF